MNFDEMSPSLRSSWAVTNAHYWDSVRMVKSCRRSILTAQVWIVIYVVGSVIFALNDLYVSAVIWIGFAIFWWRYFLPRHRRQLSEAEELVRDWENLRDEYGLPAFRKDYS